MHERASISFCLRMLLAACFLLCCPAVRAADFPPIPDKAAELLRHDKHGILAYGCSEDGRCGIFLITRKKTHFISKEFDASQNAAIRNLREAFRRPPNASSLSTRELYDASHQVFLTLVQPMRRDLDELYQITVYPGMSGLEGLPFEALVVDGGGPYHKRRFLTELWAVSYLLHFDFLRVEDRPYPEEVRLDEAGSYFRDLKHPNAGTVLSNRHGRSVWLPQSIERHFWENVRGGDYVDEALGLARSAYFDSLRAISGDSIIPPALDARLWASAAILGDIAPTHPRKGFPWWILVPLGLILVILFGKRL